MRAERCGKKCFEGENKSEKLFQGGSGMERLDGM
jgi:hypothetical protein